MFDTTYCIKNNVGCQSIFLISQFFICSSSKINSIVFYFATSITRSDSFVWHGNCCCSCCCDSCYAAGCCHSCCTSNHDSYNYQLVKFISRLLRSLWTALFERIIEPLAVFFMIFQISWWFSTSGYHKLHCKILQFLESPINLHLQVYS